VRSNKNGFLWIFVLFLVILISTSGFTQTVIINHGVTHCLQKATQIHSTPLLLASMQNVRGKQELVNIKKNVGGSSHDPWLGKDKLDHFLTSAFLVGAAYNYNRELFSMSHKQALRFSVSFSFTIGVSKEVWDKTSKRGSPSYRDLVADLLGIGLGFLILSQAN